MVRRPDVGSKITTMPVNATAQKGVNVDYKTPFGLKFVDGVRF
jgi:hypothetical protein